MEASLVTKLQELIHQGDKLVPEGGLEFVRVQREDAKPVFAMAEELPRCVEQVGEKWTCIAFAAYQRRERSLFLSNIGAKGSRCIERGIEIR